MAFDSSTFTANTDALASDMNDLRRDVVENAGDFATSGGSGNAYTLSIDSQIVTAYSAKQVFKFVANHTNTGAATLNVNSIGAVSILKLNDEELSADDIQSGQLVVVVYDGTNMQMVSPVGNKSYVDETLNAGETINGGTLPVPVYQSTSDNELYACDGNDTAALNFIGFAISNSTDGNPISFQPDGIVDGFSGLSEGETYYVQDAVGTIGTTPGTYPVVVGRAISTTEILIIKSPKYACGSVADLTTTSAANNDVTATIGFKPRMIILHFFIQGHDASTATNQYLGSKGHATYTGTTLSNVYYDWVTPGVAGDGLTGDDGTPNDWPAALDGAGNDPVSASAPSIGTAGAGDGDISTSLSIQSLSNTGFTIRRTTAVGGGSTGNNARAKIAFEAWE